MRSTDLTRQQLERIERVVQRHRRYYALLWKRAQANDMPLDDPFVHRLCKAAEYVCWLHDLVTQLKQNTPRPHRPLVEPGKTSGLAYREQPWAEQQRRKAEEVQREAEKPEPPR